MIEFTLPIKTVNESNGTHGSHWPKTIRRRKQRETMAKVLRLHHLPQLPVKVLCTRICSRELDEHDGLPGSFKSIVDEIAKAYELPDNDKRFTWNYAQEKCKRGSFGVRVRIESRGEE